MRPAPQFLDDHDRQQQRAEHGPELDLERNRFWLFIELVRFDLKLGFILEYDHDVEHHERAQPQSPGPQPAHLFAHSDDHELDHLERLN